ncbi:hypothetical protein N7492_007714 [Penicillium capsulatum]|uniref:EGF-like domain-containing protein n=1 Tax=Penicillium capsulatum TaxID=69766 RepID=A0A9W9I0C5_9EURO|nr:hypothetical protein N7492_007714 [Penicillium capsulatum]KAJ6117546.1 hypothetical protein N7512_007271 [Penicillium capsulatum]
MSLQPPGYSGPRPSPSETNRAGSVKRARELLEAGVRPTTREPPVPIPRPPPANMSQQWPLPASGLQPGPLNPHHPRFQAPRGPPPRRPPRPSEAPLQVPSPSIYSVQSGQGSEMSLPSTSRPAPSFSQPKPYQQPPPRPRTNDGCVSPTSTVDLTPRISITTDDLFRQSTGSASSASIPNVPLAPLPVPRPSPDPRPRTAGLVAPLSARKTVARRSFVSPIPEELSDPRQTLGSIASSRAIPSSWGSGPAESEILGAYLADDSSDDAHPQNDHQDDATLVRSASLGKRGKPTMRTIMNSNPASEVSVPDMPASTQKDEPPRGIATSPLVVVNATNQELHVPNPTRRFSTSTTSNESYVDPEKPRFAQQDYAACREALEKENYALPKAAPTMSDKRPEGRRPPRLDIGAVRDAETRGSLSSLSDLIRRATKLASNLDRGRTASRADLATAGADHQNYALRGRNSGSLSDILASFPNPGLTPEGRGSWPVFFGRSNLRNAEPLGSSEDDPHAKRAQRRCCGMPRKWFILLCILLFIVVALAVLLPVLLVAVPKGKTGTSCSETTPCRHGGVSVSSGSTCSCVCANGYMGSQCTTPGDSSCTAADVDNGTVSKKATMGTSLPSLLNGSQEKFGIKLDAVTIMATFSLNNVSCKTENAVVAFDNLSRGGHKHRRSDKAPIVLHSMDSWGHEEEIPSRPVLLSKPRPVVAARALATSNGVLYDDTVNSDRQADMTEAESTESSTSTTAAATATASTSVQTTSTAKPRSATSTSIPDEVIEFSQVVVLYVLQDTGSLESAMSSGSQIEKYLHDSYATTGHPSLDLMGRYGLDFENMTMSGG